jgi:hypothetical protein
MEDHSDRRSDFDRPIVVSAVAYVLADRALDRRVLALSWSMLALAGIALVHAALSARADTQLAERSIRAAINTIGAAALCTLYAREFGSEWPRVIVRHVFWSIAAHAGLVIAMDLLPSLRTAIYRITDTARYINDTTSFKMGLRIPGLTYGLSQTSVLHLFRCCMPLVANSQVVRSFELIACGNCHRCVDAAGWSDRLFLASCSPGCAAVRTRASGRPQNPTRSVAGAC